VSILSEAKRIDADLRAAVLQALVLDATIPATVDAKVYDGIVTLTGTTEWQNQRDEAEFAAGNVEGVTGRRTPATSRSRSGRRSSGMPG
jgi:osmotically-inducible protein OsmY